MNEEREAIIRQRVREAIARSRYSQNEIAALVGSSQSQVSAWAKGASLPGAVKLSLLCEALGIDPAWALGLSEGRER